MKMCTGNVGLNLLIIILSLSCANGFFTLIGSRTTVYRENYQLHLTVDSKNLQPATKLYIELTGKKSDNTEYQTVNLDAEYQLITFDMTSYPVVEAFNLTAYITASGYDYKQSVDVFTIARRFSVFIQTDKGIYKPNDEVKFRVLVLDAETRPITLEKIVVKIEDLSGKIVVERAQLSNPSTGVYVGSYAISDIALQGDWKIIVGDVDTAQISTRSFEVSEHVLPRFSAHIESDSRVFLNASNLSIKVYGEYTFGEFVMGTVNVTASVRTAAHPETEIHKVTRTATISAKKLIEFKLGRELRVASPSLIRIDLSFVESLTDKIATATKTIVVLEREKYEVELIATEQLLKPGFPFSLRAFVRKSDGTEERSATNKVKFSVVYFNRKKQPVSSMNDEERSLTNGFAELSFDAPNDTIGMTVTAEYLEAKAQLNVTGVTSKSREYLRMKIANEKSKVGDSLMVKVLSTKPRSFIFCVISGQLHMSHKKIENPSDSASFEFEVEVTKDMAPFANIIVYYIHSRGEIIYDRLKINVEKELTNRMEMSFGSNLAAPGDNRKISVKASPNAFVGVLAVDKSVVLQKKSNDLDKLRVLEELLAFNPSANYWPLNISGSESKYLKFGGENAFVLTDDVPDDGLFRVGLGADTDDDEDEYDNDIFLDEPISQPAQDTLSVRKDFPATWLFENFNVNGVGEYSMIKKVPDTITSWILTGFALDPENGLAIAEPQKLLVKKDFFIKLNLPYSIRFGEILEVEVLIFNYNSVRRTNVGIEVMCCRDFLAKDFVFIDKKSKCGYTESTDNERMKTVSVPSNSMQSTSFIIKPTVTGKIKINVKATNQELNLIDEVEKEFLVEHDGVSHIDNTVFPIEAAKATGLHRYEINLMSNVIPKSVKIGGSMVGDLLGPALLDVSKLIRLPIGCGEQRLVTFLPTAVATKYLKLINQLSSIQKGKSESYLQSGYNKILEQRNSDDGSFNLWGYERSDSIWLTAYIAKCLGHAKGLVEVNDAHITKALDFLKSKQDPSGSFSEYGKITQRRIQGGLSAGVPLTAYVTIAFLENSNLVEKYSDVISKALNHIDKNKFQIGDNYAMAISAYALALGKHKTTKVMLNNLKRLASVQEDKMYWTKGLFMDETSNLATEVEIAAYALLAFLKSGDTETSLSIMRWLISKRNKNGGFYSTQDTVIGIQALAAIAEVYYEPNINMTLKMSYDGLDKIIEVNKSSDNKEFDLPSTSRSFVFSATGTGKALFNIWHSYHTNEPQTSKFFNLRAKVLGNKNSKIFFLEVCVKLAATLGGNARSDMAVIEIALPSGYVYDPDATAFLKEKGVKKVETRDRKTVVVLYFDQMTEDPVCPEISAIREYKVEEMKSSPIKVYDFYDPAKRAVEYYTSTGAQACHL